MIALPWKDPVARPALTFVLKLALFLLSVCLWATWFVPNQMWPCTLPQVLEACMFSFALLLAGSIGPSLAIELGLCTYRRIERVAICLLLFPFLEIALHTFLRLVLLWHPPHLAMILPNIAFFVVNAAISPLYAQFVKQAAAQAEAAVGHKLVVPPGSWLRKILSFVFSARTMVYVFDPVLADTQAEWLDAIVDGDQRRSSWIRARGCLTLMSHVFAQLPVSVARAIYEAWKASK